MFVPLKGTPRPAGLERIPSLLSEETSEFCSMGPIGICLGAKGREPADAVLLVRMREGGKAWHSYALCEPCARAGGDGAVLDERRERLPTPTGWERELADTG